MGNSDKEVVLLDEAFLEEVIFKPDVEGWGKWADVDIWQF